MTPQVRKWLRWLRLASWGVALVVFYVASEASKQAWAGPGWFYASIGLGIFALPALLGTAESIVRKRLGLPRHVSTPETLPQSN